MKTTFGVLFAITLILGLASTVAANSQLRTALQVESASNWQHAAQVAGVATQLFTPACRGQDSYDDPASLQEHSRRRFVHGSSGLLRSPEHFASRDGL
jgi:hypothetical protein